MARRRSTHTELDFWQSNADLMTGLLLVFMLLLMLLMLYLLQIPEFANQYETDGDNYNISDTIGDNRHEGSFYPGDDEQGAGDGYKEQPVTSGGGGGGDEHINDEEDLYPIQLSSGDNWSKAAVLATVIDVESGRALRVADITFELYEEQEKESGGSLRTLNTYYPEKVEYKSFATTDKGTFYLPEKIEEGHYYFKQITEIEGYDLNEATYFDVDKTYDWSDPFVVSIEVAPAKNIVYITYEDMDTQEPITEGTFLVKATEDIKTSDDTVRYKKNEVADTIELDEEGNGQSEELYLGSYTVVQGEVPQYYAVAEEIGQVDVENKKFGTLETIKFYSRKTSIGMTLSDSYYPTTKIEGARFELTCIEDPAFSQIAETDKNGKIEFTDLEKSKVYVLRQLSASGKYRYDSEGVEFTVDASGHIDGEARAEVQLTNFVPRMSIEIQDILFQKSIADQNVALYSEDSNQLIERWTTVGEPYVIEDLHSGSYYVQVGSQKYAFTYDDQQALQKMVIDQWTPQSIAAAGIGGLAAILAAVLLFFGIKNRMQKRAASK